MIDLRFLNSDVQRNVQRVISVYSWGTGVTWGTVCNYNFSCDLFVVDICAAFIHEIKMPVYVVGFIFL